MVLNLRFGAGWCGLAGVSGLRVVIAAASDII